MNNATGTLEAAPLLLTEVSQRHKFTPTEFVIYLIGFSEGLTHLASLSLYYLFKDDLGLDPPAVSAIFFAPTIPWILKPVFAFCSDSYAFFGYRRKPYIIFFSCLQALGFLMLSFLPPQIHNAVISLILISTSSAFCSAIAEALVVEQSLGKTHGESANQISDFITSKALGSLLVAYLSGYLLEKVSKKEIFMLTSLFPLAIAITSIFIEEVPTSSTHSSMDQLKTLMKFLNQRVIWGPALYILMYMLGPDYDDALFFFYTERLRFTPSFMGTLRFTYGVAALVGISLYRLVLKTSALRTILFWTIVVSLPIYVSPIALISGYNKKLGISDKLFVLSGGFLVEATAEIQLLPLLVLSASICPPGLEGSVYAVMMSIRNLGGGISRILSALTTFFLGITATNFRYLSIYVCICGTFLLLPLLFLKMVPTSEEVELVKAKYDLETQGNEEVTS